MEKLMKIWLVLFTIYLILYLVDMIGDRNYGRYVSIGSTYTDYYLDNMGPSNRYKILDKRTGKISIK